MPHNGDCAFREWARERPMACDIARPLPPGETQQIEFTLNEFSTCEFRCSIYCGKGHNDIEGKLVVLEALE